MRIKLFLSLLLVSLCFGIHVLANSQSFVSLGNLVNTPEKELYPVVNGNADLLLFTRVTKTESGDTYQLMLSRKNIQWQEPVKVNIPSTVAGFRGCTFLSENGNTLILFAQNEKLTELYLANLAGSTITNIEKLDSRINANAGEGAWLSEDGKSLYFVAERSFGMGGTDIYQIEKSSNGKWRNAVELPNKINSDANEKFPSLVNNRLLFFTKTKGNTSDIYLAHKFDSYWNKAKKVVFPEAKGLSLLNIKPNGTLRSAIINTQDANGNADIYEASLSEEQLSIESALITGHVLLGEKLKALDANVRSCANGKVFKNAKEKGAFVINAKPGVIEHYIVEIEGYEKIGFTLNLPYGTDFQEYYVQVLVDKLEIHNDEIGQKVAIKMLDLNKANMENVTVATNSSKIFDSDAERYETLEDALYQTDSSKKRSAIANLFFESPLMVSNEATTGVKNFYGFYYQFAPDLVNTSCGGTQQAYQDIIAEGLPASGVLSESKLIRSGYKLTFALGTSEITSSQQKTLEDLAKQCLARPDYYLAILVFAKPDAKNTKELFTKRSAELLNQFKINHLPIAKVIFANTKDDIFAKAGRILNPKDKADTYEIRLVSFKD